MRARRRLRSGRDRGGAAAPERRAASRCQSDLSCRFVRSSALTSHWRTLQSMRSGEVQAGET
jgi:hypothetical protein